MEVKRIRLLNQKSEDERRAIVAEGLTLIAQNVSDLCSEAKAIWKTAPRSARMALNVAEEEASKGILLIDYMRPYQGIDVKQRANHLKQFYSHLARGIYARYYEWRCAHTFSRVSEQVAKDRRSHYLDGPTGADYIFRNEPLENRESIMYVDLVSDEGNLRWVSPDSVKFRYQFYGNCFVLPEVCNRFMYLQSLGLLSGDALKVLAGVWRNESLIPETDWSTYADLNSRFLEECRHRGVVIAPNGREVGDALLFPLCGLDLTPEMVELEGLHQAQAAHYSDYP